MRKHSIHTLVGLLIVALVGMMTPAVAGIIVTVGKTGPAATGTTSGPDRLGMEPCLDEAPGAIDPMIPTRSGPRAFDTTPLGSEEAYPTDEEAAGMDCQPVGGGIMWCRRAGRHAGASAGAAGGGGLSDDDMMDVDGAGDLEALGCSGGGSQAPLALLLGVFGFLGLRVRARRTH